MTDRHVTAFRPIGKTGFGGVAQAVRCACLAWLGVVSVVILTSGDGAEALAKMPPARDFAADAFAHCKFIGYTAEAQPLLEKAVVWSDRDEGCIDLSKTSAAGAFVETCHALRFWDREAKLG